MDRGAWQATVRGALKESDTTEATSHTHIHNTHRLSLSPQMKLVS